MGHIKNCLLSVSYLYTLLPSETNLNDRQLQAIPIGKTWNFTTTAVLLVQIYWQLYQNCLGKRLIFLASSLFGFRNRWAWLNGSSLQRQMEGLDKKEEYNWITNSHSVSNSFTRWLQYEWVHPRKMKEKNTPDTKALVSNHLVQTLWNTLLWDITW